MALWPGGPNLGKNLKKGAIKICYPKEIIGRIAANLPKSGRKVAITTLRISQVFPGPVAHEIQALKHLLTLVN